MQANEAGIESYSTEEYSAFTNSIEADKNLRVVLKKSGGTHFPKKEAPADEPSAISRSGATILAGEQRLRKINGK
jgi:hypothetical protein